MPRILRFRYLLRVFAVVALLGIAVAALAMTLGPLWLEAAIVEQITRHSGLDAADCRVRRVGLRGLDLSDLRLGEAQRPLLKVDSLRCDYSPRSLLRRHIDRMVVSGMVVECAFVNGRWRLPGLDPARLRPGGSGAAKAEAALLPSTLPVSFERLAVRGAVANLRYEDVRLQVPFELDIVPTNGSMRTLNARMELFPRGQRIVVTAEYDLPRQSVTATLDTSGMQIERFIDLTGQRGGLFLRGAADLHASMALSLAPFEVGPVAAKIVLRRGACFYRGIQAQTPDAGPMQIELRNDGPGAWKVAGGPLRLTAPVPFELGAFEIRLGHEADALAGKGTFSASVNPDTAAEPARMGLARVLPLEGQFDFTIKRKGPWQFSMDAGSSATGVWQRAAEDVQLHAIRPRARLTARGERADAQGRLQLDLEEAALQTPRGRFAAPGIHILAETTLAFRKEGLGGSYTLRFKRPSQPVRFQQTRLQLPGLVARGNFARRPAAGWEVDGRLAFSDGHLSNARPPFGIEALRGDLAYRWPPPEAAAKGEMKLQGLQWKALRLGDVAINLRQVKHGLAFRGRHVSALVPGLKATIEGRCTRSASGRTLIEAGLALERPLSAAPVDVGRLFPAAGGLGFNGKLDAAGQISYDGRQLDCAIEAEISQGRLDMADKKLVVEGLRGKLAMPDLGRLRSDLVQPLRFDRASLGNLTVTNGEVDFQMDANGTVLVEKGRFGWCRGSVETHALRITPGVHEYDLVLYCDRLNLAQMLEQLGAARAEGQGAVNGKIPVRFKDGHLSFHDGFLYSTPGEGGTIRLLATDVLTAGIPAGTTQFSQLELAREALKNYVYDWAKVGLDSEGQELLLRLQLDGKPSDPLPFVFDEKRGGFIRVGPQNPGSRFQGISLDVNFRLPLNQLLEYRGLLKIIRQN